MTWTRLSDTFNLDPRLLECSRDARLLHVESLVYCNQQLTDGRMPYGALRRVTDSDDPEAAVAELVAAGVWEPVPDAAAWLIDWSDQIDGDEVKAGRARNAERQRRFRERRSRHDADDHSMCDARFCPAVIHSRNALRNASSNGGSNGPPSRPVPNRDSERARSGAAGSGRRATPTSKSAAEPRPPWPPWCGECHEKTRQLDTEPPERCPSCHPNPTPVANPATELGSVLREVARRTPDSVDLAAEVADALSLGNDERPPATTGRRIDPSRLAQHEPFKSRRGAS